MTYLFTQIDWGMGIVVYIIAFLTGLIGSWGFSGAVLPMVGQIVEPQYAATTFALLFSFIQGAITAIYLLLIKPLAKALGSLDKVFLFMVCLPYAVNAVFWIAVLLYLSQGRARSGRPGWPHVQPATLK